MKNIFTKNKKVSKNSGYTIIETMIAISVFLVIIMAGMGALLNANLLHQKSRDMRSIIDSLSYAMDDMSKNLRTGTNYQCFSSESSVNVETLYNTDPLSCDNGGWAVAFESSDGVGPDNTASPAQPYTYDQWVYEIAKNGSGNYTLFKSVDGASSFIQLLPDEVHLDKDASSFTVTGAESSLSGDFKQPFVTLKLVGSIDYKGKLTPFSLETSVSQRLLDN